MDSDDPELEEPQRTLTRNQSKIIATSGVSATAGVSIASIILSLGTEGAAVIAGAVAAAIVGTLSALGRRRR